MSINILEYLDDAAEQFPDKIAYFDETTSLTYKETEQLVFSIATKLISKLNGTLKPILIYMDKSPRTLTAFWGTVYSRNFYVPLDVTMPEYRLRLIVENLRPAAIITDMSHYDMAKTFCEDVFAYEEMMETDADMELIRKRRMTALDTDPVYVLYTSGSTGVPKGVVVNHKSLLDYVDQFCDEVGILHDDIIANQAPFYFDASLIDIYCTLKMGATMGIVPLAYFSIPLKLLTFLDENNITAIRWVPSAMKIVSTFKGFKTLRPKSLRTIIFGAESMPTKVYNYWKKNYPDAKFVQIYGPTEITGVCTYYVVDRDFADDETIPIGKAFRNTEVFLLDEDNKKVTRAGVIGEICVKGTGVSMGYYNAPEKSKEVFVQNPLNPYYEERIYRTGDLAKYNEYKELVFVSRKDFQVKHMGHRIELGEIENVTFSLPGMKACCCLFEPEKQKIVLFYETDQYDDEKVMEQLKSRLQRYMLPNVLHKLDKLPLTPNGKVDRVSLKNQM